MPVEPLASAGSFSNTERFRLTGPSIVLDPAVHAYRSDIADIALAGQLFAPHYARPAIRKAAAAADVFQRASAESEIVCALQSNDEFAVLDVSSGWAWGYCRASHRVGYVAEAALVA